MASNQEVIRTLDQHIEDLQSDLDGCEKDYSRLRRLIQAILSHWDEFGPEHGFEEVLNAARNI